MKYIDADRLQANIREIENEFKTGNYYLDNSEQAVGYYNALMDFERLIDSLQQDQPDCHTVEEWMQHIKNSDQLTKDIFSKGPYYVLYDALNHPYQHCYDAIKEFGELCFQTGVNSVKQEQPSLPSDLDEAAFSYENDIWESGFKECGYSPQEVSDAFKAGAEWMKAKMMKDAVEGVVCYGSKGAYIETDFLGEYDTDVYGNSGDKARVIVIKEEK